MKITEEKFCDHGEQDADGFYDYYYAGVVYTLRDGDVGWEARSYDDDKETVSFLSSVAYNKTSRGWRSENSLIETIPYEDPHFAEAVKSLIAKGHETIKVLTDNGYTKVDFDHLFVTSQMPSKSMKDDILPSGSE